MKLLLVLLQLYTIQVDGIKKGNYYYARVSPAKVFNERVEVEMHFGGVIMVLHDTTLINTQHHEYYGLKVPYFRLKCEIVSDDVAYYMSYTDFKNDSLTLNHLTE